MKDHKIIFLLVIGLGLMACNLADSEHKEISNSKDTVKQKTVTVENFYVEQDLIGDSRVTILNPTVDSLYDRLQETGKDGIYYLSDGGPLLFLNSGHILDENEINAVIISNPADTSYQLELYTLENKSWLKNDQAIMSASPGQFKIDFLDFDFDGFKDIFVQVSASNGYSISRGHLLTIDKKTKKLSIHPEADDLGNLQINENAKRVISEELIDCDYTKMNEVCKLTHRWKNGKLVMVKRDCPCKE